MKKHFQRHASTTQKLSVLAFGAASLLGGLHAQAKDGGGSKLFLQSASEHPDGTVTLPLYKGTSHGDSVFYILLNSSNDKMAEQLGISAVQKLKNATTPGLVQRVGSNVKALDFPASVDFRPEHILSAPGPFPPAQFAAGAVGESGYSPLVSLSDGTIFNAPQIARDQNHDGRIDLVTEAADKVVSIDLSRMLVTYRETNGFAGGKAVRYVSTEATTQLAAALEDATLAPALDLAPTLGDDSTASSRATLVAFVNGQTGASNPQHQGLNSAVAGDGDPLNVLAWAPNQGRYSPLWDVHLARWSDRDVAAGLNVLQTDVGHIQGLADHGEITAPDGSSFDASDFIVNCPIISMN